MDIHFCAQQNDIHSFMHKHTPPDSHLVPLLWFPVQCYVRFIMRKLNFFPSLFFPMNCTKLIYLEPLFTHIDNPQMFLYIPQSVSLEMLWRLPILTRVTAALRNNGPLPRLLLYSLLFNLLQIPSLNIFLCAYNSRCPWSKCVP